MKIGFWIWLTLAFVNFAGNLLRDNDELALLWLITIILSMIMIHLKDIRDVLVATGEGDKNERN